MNLTTDLVEEHKLIKRMIDVLEKSIAKLEKGETVNPLVFEQATDFVRNFADKFHHAKEEDILFKEMVKKGMPEKDSPIEAMLIEHDQGREFVKGVVNATEDLQKGNKEAVKELIRNAKGYIELLREHIEKENDILYPLAERMFTEDEKSRQNGLFKEANLKKGGQTTADKYKDIVISLEKN
jgi:hemerythrin-like domain-containing protein